MLSVPFGLGFTEKGRQARVFIFAENAVFANILFCCKLENVLERTFTCPWMAAHPLLLVNFHDHLLLDHLLLDHLLTRSVIS